MQFVISGTWGPTDPTRAMLPFIFSASAVQASDTVKLRWNQPPSESVGIRKFRPPAPLAGPRAG